MTLNEKQGQHLKYMPYVFTEQGVAMLSRVLRSKIHKYKVSNEKDLDFSDGDALHRFFYRL